MQQKPAGWPEGYPVETLPQFVLELPGSAWPPASTDTPAGSAVVGQWSVDRQLTGGMLPGQVRGASGFSIASGQVQIPQPEALVLSPWGRGGARMSPGGACSLYATHDGPASTERLNLGRFVIAPIRGASTTGTIELELDEASMRLRRPVSFPWRRNEVRADRFEMDAAWVLDQIARSAGYWQTPGTRDSTIMSLPLVGGTMAERGNTMSATAPSWVEFAGKPGLGPGGIVIVDCSATLPKARELHVSAEVAGTGGQVVVSTMWFNFRGDHVIISHGTKSWTIPYPAGPNFNIARVRVSVANATSLTPTITVHSSPTQASAPLTVTLASKIVASDNYKIAVRTDDAPAGRFIRSVMLDTVPVNDWAFTPTARINLTGSPLHAAFDATGTDGWSLAQNIASATFGAVWVDEAGVFTYKNRSAMRTGNIVESVEALDSIETLDWVIDPADTADRVELSYTPTRVVASDEATTVWEATESIRVGIGQTITLVADLTGAVSRLSPFKTIWDTSAADVRFSRWAAATSADGGGERPSSKALRITATMTGTSQVTLNITNTTQDTLWVVDGNGDPCLILRTSTQVIPGESLTIWAGEPLTRAISVLTLDCGSWVQDSGIAQELLSWVSGQTRQAKAKIEQVRVKPDLARQLGDVVRLTDGHTGLLSKALIVGIGNSGDANGYTQRLDLALLALTWDDYDQWLQQHGINSFNQLDQWLQDNSIGTFNAFDEWGIDFGGEL